MDASDGDNNDHMDTSPPPAEFEIQDLDALMQPATSSSLNSSPASASPSSSERIGMRRTRVDDDHDDERDRRHPSQRVGSPFPPSPSLRSSSSSSILPAAAPASTSIPSEAGRFPGVPNPPTSGPFRFFQHMPPLASPSNPSSPHVHLPPPYQTTPASEPPSNTSTGGAAPSSNEPSSSGPNFDPAATRPPRLNIVHQYLGGFAISFDVNGARTTVPLPGTAPLASNAPRPSTDTNAIPAEVPHSGPAGENPTSEQSQSQPQPQHQQQRRFPGDAGPTNNSIADFLRHLSILTALSMGGAGLFDRDTEDPERAKKLVDGLEDVPVGLVRRLERVGKASGNSDEGAEAEGTGLGDGGCAICWERLLTREREETSTTDEEHTGAEGSSSVPPAATSTSHPPPTIEEAESANLDNDEGAIGDYKRIVSLPCAHVFHAKCLIPWFSKPKQTTCPICRFNIDPENLTYTSGAQRRAAARREREQERARARAEGRADNEERDEEDEDRNGGDGLGFGTDIPLFGTTPIVVPLGGARRQQPADTPQTGAQDQPAAEDVDADAPAEDDTPHAGDHPHDHRLHDIVTIGVDMYIGRGPPPPFAMRGGANAFQFPFPGGTDGPPMNTGPPGNPPSTNANANNADDTSTSQPHVPNAGEGNAQANDRGNGSEGRGTAFAIPLGQGFGRIIGETFSRMFNGGHATENGNRDQVPTTTMADGSGPTDQPQGPAMFGPERPPAPLRGSMPIPGGVGIGAGGGRGPISFSFPVGGAPGGDTPQNGGPQQGAGGGAPRMFETMIPLLDILFGPRTAGQGQGEGQVPAEPAPQPSQPPTEPQQAPQAAAQPAQPQPQHPQQANPPTTGFGWTFISGPPGAPPTFISGSPLPRPASAPASGQQRQRQEPRKVWVPPPAPGLSLRQRVERKEQEAGLRCCDVSCGVGPSDEDPWVDVDLEGLKQLRIRRFEGVSSLDSGVVVGEALDGVRHRCHDGDDDAVCDHTFHSSCLVSSERVASRGASPAFLGPEGEEEVEVSCPVCRGAGRVSREDWESGVRALG